MAHKLKLLTQKLENTPHLIDASSFQNILNYLDERNKGEMVIGDVETTKAQELSYNADTATGTIFIDGPLTYKSSGWEALCGGCSYESIVNQYNSLLDQGAKTVLLWADSGGGEAYGMMETGRYLRKRADEDGVKLVAYVDGLAASACYGLVSAAHEIVMNPNSEAGSIGVVVRLANNSKAMKKAGVETTYVYAGGSKIPFKNDGSFREEFLADIQSKVDALYEEFTSYVADMRGVDVEQVKGTDAKVFMASQSVSLGLADKIMTHSEFYDYLADNVEKEGKMLSKNSLFSFIKQAENNTNDEVEMLKLEEMQAAFSKLEAEHEGVVAKFAEVEKELAAQLEKVTALSAELEEAKSLVAEGEKAKADLEAVVATNKMNARKEAIASVEADADRAEKLYTSLEALSDDAFAAVMDSMSAKEQKLEESELFTQMSENVEEEVKKPVSFANFMPKKNK